MTALEALTDVQADAVHATAAKHLRDPEELAAELAVLLTCDPVSAVTMTTQEARTVVFEANVAAPVWTLPAEQEIPH